MEHNTASTDAYLPSLEAAVLVTSADPPRSAAERAFLAGVMPGLAWWKQRTGREMGGRALVADAAETSAKPRT